MTIPLQDYVNGAPASNSIGDIDSFFLETLLSNPIDSYVEYSRSPLGFGTETNLKQNSYLGGLLLLGAVSAAEAYFRSIFSMILEICPISREHSAEKQINLGGVLWHGPREFRRSAFEHLTFCSKNDVQKHTKAYLKFDLKDSQFRGPLDEFEKVCHLRHGLVHNAGVLPGRNAVQIGAKNHGKPVRISLDFGRLQRSIAVIDTLVLTFNRELFDEMCDRWATSWRKRSDWDGKKENEVFDFIWDAHFCEQLPSVALGRTACLTEVKRTYDL